jgi:hypothetical protein
MKQEANDTLDKFWKFCWLIGGIDAHRRDRTVNVVCYCMKSRLRHYGLSESYRSSIAVEPQLTRTRGTRSGGIRKIQKKRRRRKKTSKSVWRDGTEKAAELNFLWASRGRSTIPLKSPLDNDWQTFKTVSDCFQEFPRSRRIKVQHPSDKYRPTDPVCGKRWDEIPYK